MYLGRTRKTFSICTLETLFAKREAGYTRHHIFYIQSVEKEVQILGPRPRKARCVRSQRQDFITMLFILVTQSIALMGFNFIENEIISVQ